MPEETKKKEEDTLLERVAKGVVGGGIAGFGLQQLLAARALSGAPETQTLSPPLPATLQESRALAAQEQALQSMFGAQVMKGVGTKLGTAGRGDLIRQLQNKGFGGPAGRAGPVEGLPLQPVGTAERGDLIRQLENRGLGGGFGGGGAGGGWGPAVDPLTRQTTPAGFRAITPQSIATQAERENAFNNAVLAAATPRATTGGGGLNVGALGGAAALGGLVPLLLDPNNPLGKLARKAFGNLLGGKTPPPIQGEPTTPQPDTRAMIQDDPFWGVGPAGPPMLVKIPPSNITEEDLMGERAVLPTFQVGQDVSDAITGFGQGLSLAPGWETAFESLALPDDLLDFL